MLFGSYRRGDANDPDAYVASVAAVLSIYEPDLMREVTDPRSGIQTTEKYMTFMPNAGELKVYCEGVATRRARIKKLGELPRPNFERLPPPPPGPGAWAHVFVPETNRRYQQLLKWSETADEKLFRFERGKPGIFVALSVLETGGDARQIAKSLPETPVPADPKREDADGEVAA